MKDARAVGYLGVVIGLAMVLVVESVALHALVRLWSGTAAWLLTGLSAYALVWFVGDYRAIAARPLRITPRHLEIRLGLRWEADIPIGRIAQVDLLRPHERKTTGDALVVALLGQPDLKLKLRKPVQAIGTYGLRRTASELWLRVDEAEKLCAELRGSVP